MRLGGALFLGFVLIVSLCFAYPVSHMAGSLRTRYLEGVEEPLVDQANILAALVGRDMEADSFSTEELHAAMDAAHERELSARIYELDKNGVDVQVYITDLAGKVLFHSGDRSQVGEDYSGWQDVRLTLLGEYGARTTRSDPADPASAVMYVAAPIRVRGELAGVLTVAKPTASINAFMDSAKPDIFRIGLTSALAAVGLCLLVSLWVSRQIRRLTDYANDVREGRRVDLPRLAPTELRDMGAAFDKMRESLEGKKYVEQYVQTLTHEIKSPVSSIRGAAELLEEEGMPPSQRAHFLKNIRTEAGRIQDLVERMLKLSELEMRKSLPTMQSVPFAALLRTVLESKESMVSRKQLRVEAEAGEEIAVRGDPFLLHQAVSNLLQNAIDFSPPGGRIDLKAADDGGGALIFTVDDQGPGIPDYAREKIFQKFFSLQRPDTGQKSTGLGLNFVREVASLHSGSIRLENLPAAGLRASLSLPIWR
jgi:two-component system sensor histidine kinase CreC